jgi:hypothetical protein
MTIEIIIIVPTVEVVDHYLHMIQDMKVEEEIDPIHQDVVVVHDHPIVDPIVDPIVEMIVEEEVEDVHFLVHQ